MVKESWRKMQVPIMGIVGILVIFILIAIKMGVTSDISADQARMQGMAFLDPTIWGSNGCGDVYDPVCGVDGVTYDNLCLAAAADTQVAHQGGCGGG